MDSTVDLDGTLTGMANRVLITPHPIMRTPTDPVAPANWSNAFVSSNTFISTITIMPGTVTLPSMTYTRVNTSDGTRVSIASDAPNPPNHLAVLIASNPLYEYEISFGSLPTGKAVNFIVRDSMPRNFLKLKFMGLGGSMLGKLTNGNQVTSMAALDNATTSSYFRDGANLNVKIVVTVTSMDRQQSANVTWQ